MIDVAGPGCLGSFTKIQIDQSKLDVSVEEMEVVVVAYHLPTRCGGWVRTNE